MGRMRTALAGLTATLSSQRAVFLIIGGWLGVGAIASLASPARAVGGGVTLRAYGIGASTPGARLYRHFLTPGQVRGRFGVSLNDFVGSVWVGASNGGGSRRAYGTTCRAAHRAARSGFTYPVLGRVHGLTAPQLAKALRFGLPRGRDGSGQGVTVAVVAGGGDYSDRDIAFFRGCNGTRNTVTRVRVDGGSLSYIRARTLNDVEITQDVETVMSLAPRASIRVYEAPAFDPAFVLADLAAIAQDDRAQVVTVSYGACENQIMGDDPYAENLVLEVMAAQGQTFVTGSGDQGSQGCAGANAGESQDLFTGAYLAQLAVDDPASQPFATAVGGAYLPDRGDPRSAMAWNNGPFSSYAGNATTGGGVSQMWPMPPWQRATRTQANGLPADCGMLGGSRCREVPDVAGLADPRNGEVLYCTTSRCLAGERQLAESPSGWFLALGTSEAAPQWAALMAVADGGLPSRRVGLITPLLYRLAASRPDAFVPVQRGNNAYLTAVNAYGTPIRSCRYGRARVVGPCYRATSGYNLATGLGLPDASRLVSEIRAGR
jgi:subtilase family serine protease